VYLNRVAKFVGLFYAKAFLQSPLSTSAARHDLKFMADMFLYKHYDSGVADACILSCNRHTWYLTPQLVVLSLADNGVPNTERELMGQVLFDTERPEKFDSGKPQLPHVEFNSTDDMPTLRSFISQESWLMFDLLGIDDDQEWLQTPVAMWDKFASYRKFCESANSLRVVNDLAERGIKLVSDFIHMCNDEKQRQALLQCVEEHRKLYPDYTKQTLCSL